MMVSERAFPMQAGTPPPSWCLWPPGHDAPASARTARHSSQDPPLIGLQRDGRHNAGRFIPKAYVGKYTGIFDSVGAQEDMTGWEPSLPAGHHRVALVRYGVKESKTDKTQSLEGEFVILETDNPKAKVGALHSWFWNVSGTGSKWTKQYAQDRAKKFLITVAESIGAPAVEDPDSLIGPFGVELAESFDASDRPELYGVELDVEVTAVFEADGTTPVTFKKGGQVYNADWFPVAGQDEITLAATCEKLEALARRPKATTAATTAPATGAATAGTEAAPKARTILRRGAA